MKKYGRTFHLPISPGATDDDKIMASLDALTGGAELVVTEKMDGENTTIHAGGTHARSPDGGRHASRDWLKGFAAGISLQLAGHERIVGEYLFARHSIAYEGLSSYFLGFAWIVGDEIQSWDGASARFVELGILTPPLLYRGAWRPKLFENLAAGLDLNRQEGFVVRVAGAFQERAMPTHMGKWVRAGHVQSETHWTQAEITRNGLA